MNWACNSTLIFGPAPWGLGEGAKRSNKQLNFNYNVNFKDQTLYVFSQIKHIRQDFYSVTRRERNGSVVECLTQDRGAAGSSLTSVTALWSLSKTHLS